MTLSLAFLTPDFLVAPVFTDPPYNVPMKGHAGGKGRRKHREFPMASEEMTEDAFRRFLEDALGFAAAHSAEDSSVSSPFRRCWCATPLKAAVIGSSCYLPFRAFSDLLRLSSGGLAFWAGRGDLVSRRAAALDHALLTFRIYLPVALSALAGARAKKYAARAERLSVKEVWL
jgi:hypothetical protein